MRITLTADEQDLFDCIDFEAHDYRVVQKNGEAAAALTESLLARKAIPETRLRYFTDVEFNAGYHKSRKQVFVANGTAGREILTHPNYWKHLRYFICGPDLPATVITGFRALSEEPFRELEPIRVYVRARARELGGDYAGEEFFKLAVECGLGLGEAKTIRTDAMNAARAARARGR
jgi:hypothetical protein